MASCCIETFTLRGVEAVPVHAEVEVAPGLPGIEIVGLPDAAVQEARQRVRSAVRACGFSVPAGKVVVNLAPGPLKKTGSGFDLPIALGLLCASEQIDPALVRGWVAVGELSLTGEVHAVRGMVAYALATRRLGKGMISAPLTGVGLPVPGLPYAELPTLALLKRGGLGSRELGPAPRARLASCESLDFADIAGQDLAKRALQIAAAGQHGLMMVGPPGSGKTMLARRLPTILPPLTSDEMLESALIASVAGQSIDRLLAGERPFRAPHHTATAAGLLGGGNPLRPGEVSLAHNGVLFLDEMPEFSPHVLQMLRQPLEDGSVSLVRADGMVTFPARFMLVAASNPCPCGYLGDPDRRCTCPESVVARYQGRIGGPLIDRIDLRVDVPRSDPGKVLDTGRGSTSATLREQVMAARERAAARNRRLERRGLAPGQALLASCGLTSQVRAMFEALARRHHLSGRGVMGILKVARTIADLEQSESVEAEHLLEAAGFRTGEGR